MTLQNQINGVITQQPEELKDERVEPEYPFSSYSDLELDFWNSLACDFLSLDSFWSFSYSISFIDLILISI
jgi:hypothetical protein